MANSGSHLDIEIPKQMICTNCNQLIKSPLKTSCGHSFCRHCLEDLLDQQELHLDSKRTKRDPLSIGHGYIFICPYPKCGRQQRLGSKNVEEFQVNCSLQEMVEYFKIKLSESKDTKCERHQKERELFCMTCELEICKLCETEHIHPENGVCPKEHGINHLREKLECFLRKFNEEQADEELSKNEIRQQIIQLTNLISTKNNEIFALFAEIEEAKAEFLAKFYCADNLVERNAIKSLQNFDNDLLGRCLLTKCVRAVLFDKSTPISSLLYLIKWAQIEMQHVELNKMSRGVK